MFSGSGYTTRLLRRLPIHYKVTGAPIMPHIHYKVTGAPIMPHLATWMKYYYNYEDYSVCV